MTQQQFTASGANPSRAQDSGPRRGDGQATTAKDAGSRLGAVDATRGAAMLLVCLSHFADAYFKPVGYGGVYALVDRIVMIASPTFMMMSGTMLGLLFARNGRDFGATRAKLIDRGIFLITLAHLLIAVAHVPFVRPVQAVLRWGFITDTIGVSIVLGPLLVGKLRPAQRIALGLGTYLASWIAVYAWQPADSAIRLLKDALVGPSAENSWEYNFPILPWFGIYFASSAMGAWLAQRSDTGRSQHVPRAYALAGIGSIALAAAAHVLARAVIASGWLSPDFATPVRELSSIAHKIPPGPCYLLVYGGTGLLLGGACFWALRVERLRRAMSWLELLGRNSLFVFILQYYLYYGVLSLVAPRYTAWWPLYFVVTLGILFPVVKAWEKCGGNQLLTVGLAKRGRSGQRN